jgi:hypothetical protein
MFFGDLATKRIFRVADRGNVEKRIAETKWQMSDYSNSEKTADLHKGINADYLIIGTISKLGIITVVEVMLEDLNSFEVIGNSRIRMNRPEDAFDLMDGFVSTLVKNVTGGSGSSIRPVDFVRIEGGTFTMGSPASEVDRSSNETQHQVTVGSFSMGKYEVTQAEYEAVMGTNPQQVQGSQFTGRAGDLVWEWCWDWYGSYNSGAQNNPDGAVSGANRVRRGGSWGSIAEYLRSAFRGYSTPSLRFDYLGFRLVRP